jgi:putative phosphoesterase
MKALIFSDSHGNYSVMERIIKASPDVDCVVFAGDGIRDIELLATQYPEKTFFSVSGNCDYGISPFGFARDTELTFFLEGKKIFLTHGHSFGVKYSLNSRCAKAQRDEIDIVIFGHTNTPYEEYNSEERPFYFFNPGSIGRASDGGYSFGRLSIDGKNILLSHGRADY